MKAVSVLLFASVWLLASCDFKGSRDVRHFSNGGKMIFDTRGYPIYSGILRNGVKDGEWLHWHGNGFLASRSLYADRRLWNGYYFDRDGKEVSRIIEGKGVLVEFGGLRGLQLISHANGIMSGPHSLYSDEGFLSTVGTYTNSMPTGVTININADNLVDLVRIYDMGIFKNEFKGADLEAFARSNQDVRVEGLIWREELVKVVFRFEIVDSDVKLAWEDL